MTRRAGHETRPESPCAAFVRGAKQTAVRGIGATAMLQFPSCSWAQIATPPVGACNALSP